LRDNTEIRKGVTGGYGKLGKIRENTGDNGDLWGKYGKMREGWEITGTYDHDKLA
jgi:hypothetical protein